MTCVFSFVYERNTFIFKPRFQTKQRLSPLIVIFGSPPAVYCFRIIIPRLPVMNLRKEIPSDNKVDFFRNTNVPKDFPEVFLKFRNRENISVCVPLALQNRNSNYLQTLYHTVHCLSQNATWKAQGLHLSPA